MALHSDQPRSRRKGPDANSSQNQEAKEKVITKFSPMVIIILLSCILVIIVAIFASRSTLEGTLRAYVTVPWNLDLGEDPTPYTTFLANLRGHFRVEDVCMFPVTAKTTTKAKQFILVDIIDTKQRTVTLALRATDAYFLGYQDIFNGKERANFVEDNFEEWKSSDVFPKATQNNRIKLPFESSYGSMESVGEVGKKGRKNLALGITNLNSIIDTVYGQDYKGKTKPANIGRDLARFGLIVVQMVAEAARFKYIENELVQNGLGTNSFLPGDDIILLEKEWGKNSQAIHISATDKPPCVKVNKLDYPPDVDTVEGLRTYMSLLKFKK